MQKSLVRKGLVLGIIVLFVGAGFVQGVNGIIKNTVIKNEEMDIISSLSGTVVTGDIIYVDDDNTQGPWDGTQEHPYQYIQDGIDNANIGDTIFVYNGTYYEYIVIDKNINLIGEDKNITIIDSNRNGDVVNIIVDKVTIDGFTIKNGGSVWRDAGVKVHTKNNTISNNKISNNWYGIHLDSSYDNTISGNIISSNDECGIYVYNSSDNNILGNSFFNDGLFVYDSYQNIVSNNTVNSKPLVYLVTRIK